MPERGSRKIRPRELLSDQLKCDGIVLFKRAEPHGGRGRRHGADIPHAEAAFNNLGDRRILKSRFLFFRVSKTRRRCLFAARQPRTGRIISSKSLAGFLPFVSAQKRPFARDNMNFLSAAVIRPPPVMIRSAGSDESRAPRAHRAISRSADGRLCSPLGL